MDVAVADLVHRYYFCKTMVLNSYRFTKECSRFKDELDTMKFICKDFWNSVYKKQIDNLRTNHQVKNFAAVCQCLDCHVNRIRCHRIKFECRTLLMRNVVIILDCIV